MRLDLGLHPYKMVLTLRLKPHGHRMRRAFADGALEMLDADPDYGQTIYFSNKAHFWLSGYVNKKICRYWNDHQPQIFEEEGRAVTVNGERYRTMLTEFRWPELNNIDTSEMRFQQDGAACHTNDATLELLKEKSVNRIIS